MRILVVGAGATGGYFGGRLTEAGRDVTFLLRDQRAAQVRSEGLHLVSPRGDATLRPKVITAAELRAKPRPFDLVLIAVKAYSLDSAMIDIAPGVGRETLILPVLNGIRHLDTLIKRFGKERVLGGTVRIVADMSPTGVIEHELLDELTAGFLSGTPEENRKNRNDLRDQLSVQGITLVLSDDVVDAMWQKWWLLASLNVVCILANGTVGQAVSARYGEALAHAVLDECLAIASANGHRADRLIEAEMRARFSDARSQITSSMFRDLSRNQPVEADQILGDLIARAARVSVPLMTAAYVRLKVYEGRRGLQG